jgi:hypothetical protein
MPGVYGCRLAPAGHGLDCDDVQFTSGRRTRSPAHLEVGGGTSDQGVQAKGEIVVVAHAP